VSDQSESECSDTVVRRRYRRRTSRHRQNRLVRRIWLILVCSGLTVAFASAALHYLSPSLFQASHDADPSRESVEASRNLVLAIERASLTDLERPIYPYSVVPGGVRSVAELRRAADHDPVVGAHYASFDFDHARIVRLRKAFAAYVSYRIGRSIYWTTHRVNLKLGEAVITDGKIIVRTRCANRVETTPQQGTSEAEPPIIKFDEPIWPAMGTATTAPPVPFQSTMNRPQSGFGPPMPLTVYDPITTGNVIPVSPPPLPNICGIGTKKPNSTGGVGGAEPIEVSGKTTKKKPINPCGSSGGLASVPEPGTWLLLVSGLVVIYWESRQRFSRV
jgi:hypothetical protein